jgi:8-oxo-dGTP pyrophosphatase MutT (NUDIX family)
MKDAVAIVLKRADSYLLIRRAKKGEAEDYWCPITGAVEPGETQKQAVVREAAEEMGFKVKPLSKVWQCHTDDRRYMLHWWHAQLINEHVRMNAEEVKEFRWVTFGEMRQLEKMFDADLFFFKKIAPGL